MASALPTFALERAAHYQLMAKTVVSVLQKAPLAIFTIVMVFAPLARGAVHGWAQALLMAGACLLAASMLVEQARSGTSCWTRTALDTPILALLVLVGLSFFTSQNKPASTEALLLLAVYAVFFQAALHISASRSGQRYLVYLLIAMAVLLALIGLVKRFSPHTFSWWLYFPAAEASYAVEGPYGNHNHLAGYLEMVIPLLLALFLTRSRRGAVLLVLFYLTGLLLASHVLTLSRGGWISLALSLTCMAAILLAQRRFHHKKMLLLIIAAVVLLILLILGGTHIVERILTLTEDATIVDMGGRKLAWQGVLAMIADHPVLGTGPGTFAVLFPHYQLPGVPARFFHAHNDYLQAIADLGLPVIPVLLWFLLALLWTAIKKFRSPSRQVWGITLGALMGIVSILVHSSTDFNLHIPANALLLAVLLALVCSDQELPAGNGRAASLASAKSRRPF